MKKARTPPRGHAKRYSIMAKYSELDNICVWQTLSLHSFAYVCMCKISDP